MPDQEEDPRKNRDKFKTGLTLSQAAAIADQAKVAIDAGETPPEVTGGPSASAPGEDQEQT